MLGAALGFRAHSGWAAVVAVAGPLRSPAVVDRRRIELADTGIRGSVQPYHTVEEWELKEAEKFLKRCADRTRNLAQSALRAVLEELRKKGHDVVGCGLLLSSARPLPDLAATLASHALIHTAEGEFYRDALVRAGEHFGLPVTGVRERELFARGATELGVAAGELERRVGEMGRAIGPPWRQDEKYAALAAWLALAAAPKR